MRRQTLEEVGLHRARMVVVADDDAEAAARIAALVRSSSREVTIVVRAEHDDAAAELARAGADSVVTGGRASAKWLAHTVLRRYERESLFAPDRLGPTIDTDRIVRFDPAPGACPHAGSVRPVLPSAPGCHECLQLGEPWVHLRICTACGHVGCCDDSPGRHARAHATDPAHPIVRSMEPGETWGWCFVDELELPDRNRT